MNVKNETCIIYTDGGARGNPGPAAAGGVIVGAGGALVAEVSEYIGAFVSHAEADELIVAHQSPTTEARLRSVALLADAVAHTFSGSNATGQQSQR